MYSESSANYLLGSVSELPSPKSNFFNPVSGECIQASTQCCEGDLILSNYRLILHFSGSIFHIPTGTIDQAEIRKVVCLHILCKDARSYKCTFSSSEECLYWQKRIVEETNVPVSVEKVFACTFYHSTCINIPELHSFFCNQLEESYNSRSDNIFEDEVKRLAFDLGGAWRISKVNEKYQLCPSYPRKIIVPSSISDNTLEGVARFRSSRRIPTVVWRHSNGAVIARSSQPEVGLLWWRSSEDEDLVKALAEACAYDSPSSPAVNQMNPDAESPNGAIKDMHNNSFGLSDLSSLCDLPEAKSQTDIKKLLIMDARSYPIAVANRARGGGCECLEYYPKCEIQFMNLDNIHTIRKSHQALRNIITLQSDITNWLSLLENTRWLYHMSGLIKAAVTVAQVIAIEGRPVLVHCSDGWDRTPQIVALAEILLDPYYRTLEGFQVLVEREWIEFGHKFSDRCGCGVGSEDLNERCPVFLQWIDCVHQVLNQFPTVFQFNQAFLVKLAQHVYSNLFGTFLFSSSQERFQFEQQKSRSGYYSIWPLFKLHQHRYINYLYMQSNQVLYPSFHTKDLVLWKAVYMNEMGNHSDDVATVDPPCQQNATETNAENDLVKTKSCDNLLKFSLSGNSAILRRSSDPNLRESFPDMTLLKSALGSEMFDEGSAPVTGKEASRSLSSSSTIMPDAQVDDAHSKPELFEKADHNHIQNDVKILLAPDLTTPDPTDSLLQCKNKDLCKRSINGSTDTLVSEVGAIVTEEPPAIPSWTQADSPATLCGITKGAKAHVNGFKGPEEQLRKGKVTPTTGKTSLAEYEDGVGSQSYITSSVVACSICLKNKTIMGDVSDRDFWRQSSGGSDVIIAPVTMNGDSKIGRAVHSYPTHAAVSSSHIPSTPVEDRFSHMNHERTLCFSDGLTNFTDDVTLRLNQMRLQHQMEVDGLKRDIQAIKSYYNHLIYTRLSQGNNETRTEDQVSLPESVGSGSGDSVGPESSGMSDASWEALEEGEARTTLWVPDHAVDSCMGCHSEFWIGRRKHHCRNCGKIFCSECSENSVPIPKENLYSPVRVCSSCFSSLMEFRPKYVQVASN